MVRVKICGITSRKDAELAIDLGASAVGCIAVAHSRRYQSPEQIASIFAGLPPYVTRVAVVQNPDLDLLRVLARSQVDQVQFHGDESMELVAACPLPWYKAVCGADGYTSGICRYPDSPALLVDAPDGGGKGKAWHYDSLALVVQRSVPVILAGGLHPGNVREAIAKVRPWAVDVASGVESVPGVKDANLVAAFVHQVCTSHG